MHGRERNMFWNQNHHNSKDRNIYMTCVCAVCCVCNKRFSSTQLQLVVIVAITNGWQKSATITIIYYHHYYYVSLTNGVCIGNRIRQIYTYIVGHPQRMHCNPISPLDKLHKCTTFLLSCGLCLDLIVHFVYSALHLQGVFRAIEIHTFGKNKNLKIWKYPCEYSCCCSCVRNLETLNHDDYLSFRWIKLVIMDGFLIHCNQVLGPLEYAKIVCAFLLLLLSSLPEKWKKNIQRTNCVYLYASRVFALQRTGIIMPCSCFAKASFVVACCLPLSLALTRTYNDCRCCERMFVWDKWIKVSFIISFPIHWHSYTLI